MNQPKILKMSACALLATIFLLATANLISAQTTKTTSAEHHYTVQFPTPPQRTVEPSKTVNGLTFSVEQYTSTLDNQMFLTNSVTYVGTPIDGDRELKLNVDNFVKGMDGFDGPAKLLSTHPTEYISGSDRIQGIEFIAETNNLTFNGKFFVYGNDVWTIAYGARKGSESAEAKAQFFSSLEIQLKRSAPAPH